MKITIEEHGIEYSVTFTSPDTERNTVGVGVTYVDKLYRILYPEVMEGRQIRFARAQETREVRAANTPPIPSSFYNPSPVERSVTSDLNTFNTEIYQYQEREQEEAQSSF
jgi:hypothetical protein